MNHHQIPVNQPKNARVATNQTGGEMSYRRDTAPGQNPHVNYEPSLHGGLEESQRPEPFKGPVHSGRQVREVLERTNDYAHARDRYNTMQDWERDDLVFNMIDQLSQTERDVQERMLWHFFMIHDDYGNRVADGLGMSVADVSGLAPLASQNLTEAEEQRLSNLGSNGDIIDPSRRDHITASVENRQATAEEVLAGMPQQAVAAD